MCGGESARKAPPSACILMFWLTQDLLGTRLGVEKVHFSPANDSVQVRLREQRQGCIEGEAGDEELACFLLDR